MLTFKTTVTEEEVNTAIKKYVMAKMQDDLELDTDMIEITSVKKSGKCFIVQGRQKPKPPKAKKETKSKYKKSEAEHICGGCESTYDECDCVGGPICEGCENQVQHCTCK